MASVPNPAPSVAPNAPATAVDKTVNLQILSKSTVKKLKDHFASADVDATAKMCDRCSKVIGKTMTSKSDYGMDCEPGPGTKCKHCIKTKKTCEYKVSRLRSPSVYWRSTNYLQRPKRLNALLNRLIAQGELVVSLDEDDPTYEAEEAGKFVVPLVERRRLTAVQS